MYSCYISQKETWICHLLLLLNGCSSLFFQNPQGRVVFILFITASIRAETDGAFFKIRKNYFLSHENTIWNGKAASLLSCSQKCARQTSCKSASFMTNEGRCLLHDEKQAKLSGMLLQREQSFYLTKVCCAVVFCSCNKANLNKGEPKWPLGLHINLVSFWTLISHCIVF